MTGWLGTAAHPIGVAVVTLVPACASTPALAQTGLLSPAFFEATRRFGRRWQIGLRMAF